MRALLSRRRTERRGLRLWNVWIVLPAAFLTAIVTAAGVFFMVWALLGAQGLEPEPHVTAKTLFDLVKLSLGAVAGASALVALVVAYRRQRVDEDGALRDATRLHTERFTTAVAQLGEESAAVRLGGVHALAGLADDAPTRELRQTCIDVLCAYLGLPYTAEADLPPNDVDARHAYLALRQVRHTIIRLIRDHLRLAADHPHSWQGHDLNFTGVVFDGGDLSRVAFSGSTIDFSEATFSGGTVNLRYATFSGHLVNFFRAAFTGGEVDFGGAAFCGGTVDFSEARFSGGTVGFVATTFSGSRADFSEAAFSGGHVNFTGATFSGGGSTFFRAMFSGGEVTFENATFCGGTVDFTGARGDRPQGLVPLSGQPAPSGLTLPSAWHPPAS
ncbi:pentapeptide repeat-containing protein [Streptomyces niger]|uniref:pentapeptide repeat-containing protein n=1 Tax=Streptomyces niger TaxID=66373 RepID=UPI00069C8196|nr:pentapeptide repeat-containing protein [Streptomyces niger]